VETVAAGEVSFRRAGIAAARPDGPGRSGPWSRRIALPLCPPGRNVSQADRLDRPVAAVGGGSRSYLVVYLDSLLISELPDQIAEATWVAPVSDPSEHGPV
jgi:hypothetical protein